MLAVVCSDCGTVPARGTDPACHGCRMVLGLSRAGPGRHGNQPSPDSARARILTIRAGRSIAATHKGGCTHVFDDGRPCRRSPLEGSPKCWQHGPRPEGYKTWREDRRY